jgi:hypothetical protein
VKIAAQCRVKLSTSIAAMILHPLVARALTLALTVGAVASLHAQPAADNAGAPPPWAATESNTPDHAKGLPSDAALLREHLAGGSDASPQVNPNPAQKVRPGLAASAAQGSSAVANGDGGNVVANAVKDFIKPLNQEINNSEVVKAVREMDATVSGRSRADGDDGGPRYGQSGGDATGGNRSNRKADASAAALMWQQFVDDALPWAIGAAVVGVAGYGGYFWLKIIKLKRLKQGDKRRSERRSRHLVDQVPSAGVVPIAEKELAAPASTVRASTGASGSGRSSRSSSRRSSSRSSSSTSSRATNGVSGGSAP